MQLKEALNASTFMKRIALKMPLTFCSTWRTWEIKNSSRNRLNLFVRFIAQLTTCDPSQTYLIRYFIYIFSYTSYQSTIYSYIHLKRVFFFPYNPCRFSLFLFIYLLSQRNLTKYWTYYNLRKILMSETSHNKGEPLERKRHRRSRKDGHERTYVCSQCQKSYLSNAALYTHTKSKHQNIEKTVVK